MSTTAEQLAEINAAISAITGGAQEYQIGSRRVVRGQLSALLAERKHLEAKQSSEQGYDVAVAYFDRR